MIDPLREEQQIFQLTDSRLKRPVYSDDSGILINQPVIPKVYQPEFSPDINMIIPEISVPEPVLTDVPEPVFVPKLEIETDEPETETEIQPVQDELKQVTKKLKSFDRLVNFIYNKLYK